jgi:hypothetical protein
MNAFELLGGSSFGLVTERIAGLKVTLPVKAANPIITYPAVSIACSK